LPSPAAIQKARQASERGRALYLDGRYGQAIEVFLKAYQVAALPSLLYNAALAAHKLKRLKAARELLKRYLARPRSEAWRAFWIAAGDGKSDPARAGGLSGHRSFGGGGDWARAGRLVSPLSAPSKVSTTSPWAAAVARPVTGVSLVGSADPPGPGPTWRRASG
jgi:tetratricopeptide (TPR) repeat protein